MPFEPINTQEEFDQRIKERIDRAEAKVRGEYADYDDLKAAAASAQKSAEELAALKKEKADREAAEELRKVAQEVAEEAKVPASLLRGSTREELEAHAKAIAEEYGKRAAPKVPAAGGFSTDADGDDDMRKFVRQLTGRDK